MGSNTALEKTLLRVSIRKELTAMPTAKMQASDAALFEKLLALPEVAQAKTISLFWGITGLEPDTSRLAPQLLVDGKRICLPRIISDFGMELREYTPDCPMARTSFGILEPTIECPLVEKHEVDLVIVPALCYDRKGFRLGYGAGHYDRWLSDYTGHTVGMCREISLQDEVPVEAHDKPVQIIVTEHEVLRFEN